MDPELGFNDNAIRARRISAEEDAAVTEGVGAGIHRLVFDWRYAERVRDQYHWEDYDRIYRAMLARGIRPLFILVDAPRWTWGFSAQCRSEAACRFPPAEEHVGEWREIAGLLATRYPRAAGIEIWNEANSRRYWKPSPDIARYTRLLKEAYSAIKAANPRMPVLTGGFSSVGVSQDGDYSLVDFLSGMYTHGGGGHFDGLSFHAYPGTRTLEAFHRALRQVREVKARYGDAVSRLWVTETGLSTTGEDPRYRRSEAEQAAGIVDLYRRLKAAPDVDAIIFHTLIDPPGDGLSPEHGYGLLRSDLRRKPAYCALAKAVRKLERCP